MLLQHPRFLSSPAGSALTNMEKVRALAERSATPRSAAAAR